MRATSFAKYLMGSPARSAKIGQTPHSIIHRENKATLRYFAPVNATQVPVFICMPLINTWTIFDLLPGRSIVGALLAEGAPVYLLDWGRPGPEDKDVRAVELIDGLLPRAMDRALRHATREHAATELDAVGYCVGGTFLAASLARHPHLARRVAFVATPIDFKASGRLAIWADEATFPLDDVVDGFGNFPAALMKSSFAWLRPTGQVAKFKGLWDRFEDEDFKVLWAAMERWSSDNIDFPGECYREYVRACYFNNALMDGSWVLGNEATDLSKCTIPALVLAATGDHIVPPASASALAQVWGGHVETQVIKGGHVGISIGKHLPKALVAWIASGAESADMRAQA